MATHHSQFKRMSVWCIGAVTLVVIVVLLGVAVFESSGHGTPLQNQGSPVAPQ